MDEHLPEQGRRYSANARRTCAEIAPLGPARKFCANLRDFR